MAANIKLIALDVDDTLLNSDGKILSSTKNILKKLQYKGIKVVLCTGRPLAGIESFLRELKVPNEEQFAITFNGSVIQSMKSDQEILFKKGISRNTYKKIDVFSQENNLKYNVLDDFGGIYTSNHDVSRITVVQAWENQAGIFIRNFDELPTSFFAVKAVFVGESKDLNRSQESVEKIFGKLNYVVRTSPNFLEIMNRDVDKGSALKYLAKFLHISANEIIAFGDQENDIPMFHFAGKAVAMANSTVGAKNSADIITSSNDSDAIYQVLSKINF